MLLCCWLAAVGAGLLKTEEILEGVARLRLSNDIEFEEENFISLMNEAKEVSSSHVCTCVGDVGFLCDFSGLSNSRKMKFWLLEYITMQSQRGLDIICVCYIQCYPCIILI